MSASRELKVGLVVGAHGVRGALKIRLENPETAAFDSVTRVWCVEGADVDLSRTSPYNISRVSPIPGTDRIRLWLEGIATREDADALRGHAIVVDRDSLPELEDDEYYLADLVGACVYKAGDSSRRSLGTVVGVTSNGLQDLLEVAWTRARGTDATWLLPAIPEYVVDIDETAVYVDVPAGFLPTELDDDHGG